ncbi:MAG: hypothetical protein HDT20_07290 [Oscillibacter sp.]|nr:hypothetical protein [Oscillibacter sp.]
MPDILREIFDHCYEGKVGSHPMTATEREVWDRAQAVLGGDMIDKLVYAQSRSLAESQYDFFREGFLLGARLILELR